MIGPSILVTGLGALLVYSAFANKNPVEVLTSLFSSPTPKGKK